MQFFFFNSNENFSETNLEYDIHLSYDVHIRLKQILRDFTIPKILQNLSALYIRKRAFCHCHLFENGITI